MLRKFKKNGVANKIPEFQKEGEQTYEHMERKERIVNSLHFKKRRKKQSIIGIMDRSYDKFSFLVIQDISRNRFEQFYVESDGFIIGWLSLRHSMLLIEEHRN